MKRSLDALLEPKSVAVIGASREPRSVGYGVLQGLLKGCVMPSKYAKRFPGKVYAVNPNAKTIQGVKCHASVKDIAGDVDLAVICVPAKIVPPVLRECAEKRVKAAVVVSAGFAEVGDAELQEELATIAKKGGMRLLGPNCLGVIRPSKSLNASFGLSMPRAGGAAFITQSGALADSVIDWALEEMYPFSAIVSLGNQADVDEADLVEWFAGDGETKAIALYLEGVKDGKKLMAAVRKAVAAGKTVLVLKGGRLSGGAKAVSSHTGALAGSYAVFEAAMRQSGAVVTYGLADLLGLAQAASEQPKAGNSVVVVTNGGGAGVLCTDYCEEFGVNLVKIREATLRKLDATKLMHPAYSRRNPLDLIGDAGAKRYEAALDVLLADDAIKAAIVIQTLQTMTESEGDARAVLRIRKKYPKKPVICVFMGGKYSKAAMQLLGENGVPNYDDPRKAAKAMALLVGAQRF
ncbi:Acetate--CoA ligase [ADP-forming] I subunit alpha [Candidatus Norongarragalina meridionalis]|nr:Acetate--CoA ligase [ADP-forming] I subunit alpha [Candidatus Norongarragalina meridionalis]